MRSELAFTSCFCLEPDKIVVLGGHHGGGRFGKGCSRSVEQLDVNTGVWKSLP